jgi:DNA-binding HxlR family transcriptional regulator/putative sterol carrier protein
MPAHSYQQYCGAARALDVVGDRWALLIVRELMFGPRRFTDLLDGLPGISRNLLARRLRELEQDAVLVRSELPPPAARQVYELTADGRDLAEAMLPLVAWGARRLGSRRPGERFRPQWAALAMAAFADREAARGVTETYEYRVGSLLFHFTVDDGTVALHQGPAQDPAATVTTDERTWADLAADKVSSSAAVAAGALVITGDARAVKRLRRILSRSRVLAQAEATPNKTTRRG